MADGSSGKCQTRTIVWHADVLAKRAEAIHRSMAGALEMSWDRMATLALFCREAWDI